MKLCQNCGQLLAEEIMSCPSCGHEVVEGRKSIDDYRILEILHEGYSSILCRAVKADAQEPVMIRIFTPQSGVDAQIAARLKHELEQLRRLPEDYFVRHFEIRRSSDGLWYRVSEWIEALNWGTLLASGRLQDYRVAFKLFGQIASILEGLHRIGHFIPHLILDDIIVFQGAGEELTVKIDYKLSRFLDPQLDRPGPMLKKLLDCHPDIINQRPLDFRSDIWSLGKIFVEVLAADPETVEFKAQIEELPLPHEIEVLLKIMLADDPDLRPRSMAAVAETLAQVKAQELEAAMQSRRKSILIPALEIRGLKRWIRLLVLVVSALVVLGLLAWLYFVLKKSDNEAVLATYANQYASSVAFVVADYWLKDDQSIYYRGRTEGTAFLVDDEGYLLTNRHVVCPWLEDSQLYLIINKSRQAQKSLRLGYHLALWFEGQKAFKRLPRISDRADLDDSYFLAQAFSTDGVRRLAIAGVAKSPDKTWQLVKSPLKDDFAVLKIDRVPEGLRPLPLDRRMDPLKVPKLLPVIALGFPLGSRTQEATVNVSVTRGHVRRSFANFLQVDTSIYRGNSGGPIIDIHGNVIGIASSVAIDWTAGPLPVVTPLSDIGMILPITKAAAFLRELKAGQTKWNGVLDLSLDAKLKRITAQAGQRRWRAAQALADQELESSLDPALVMAGGMMHFCSGDYPEARRRFRQALSMDERNANAAFMLFLIDWVTGQAPTSPYRAELLALDWQSPHEFFGHLVRVLEGGVEENAALRGGYSEDEKSWLQFIVGLRAAKRLELTAAESRLRAAVWATDSENWLLFLALSQLEEVQRQRAAAFQTSGEQTAYQAEIEAFEEAAAKERQARAERRSKLAPLAAKLKQDSLGPEQKRAVLEEIRAVDPTNSETLVWLAFYSALDESWDQALAYARTFLAIEGRENAGRLRIGLLEPEILHRLGRPEEARAKLADYQRRLRDPWYRSIAACLLAELSEATLSAQAAENPHYLVTAHTALGFWAEGSGDPPKAIEHYREALGSYMDDMLEYEFALERVKKLRQSAD
ncbi:MAG: trypsin-like peptidase domain-containing protein [Desulfobacterales bacterium]|nr:MAG: trypsin-like peptidase domain-containing protein [Desulfobacterales bacterium]